MLLNTSVEAIESNVKVKPISYTIENSNLAFSILSKNLYADPILAIIRELITNAYDSHVLANNLSEPINIHLPTKLEPYFSIRDYGVGLSNEDIEKVYTTFFSSTKRESNEYTGCFGLGSKTPFAYSTSFTLTSYYNGIESTFINIKNKGVPQIIKLKEELTEEHNGLCINIPVEPKDFREFHVALVTYIKFIPELNIRTNIHIEDRPNPILETKDFKIYKNTYSYTSLYIKQGLNVFSINLGKYKADYKLINVILCNHTIVYEVPIGSLMITPNRETISEEEASRELVLKVLKELNDSLYLYFSNNTLNNEWSITARKYNYYIKLNKLFNNSVSPFKVEDLYNEVVLHHSTVIFKDRTQRIVGLDLDKHNLVILNDGVLDKKQWSKLSTILRNSHIETNVVVYQKAKSEYFRNFLKDVKKLKEGDIKLNISFISLRAFFKKYTIKAKRTYSGRSKYTLIEFHLNRNTVNTFNDSALPEAIQKLALPINSFVISDAFLSNDVRNAALYFLDIVNLKDTEGKEFIKEYLLSMLKYPNTLRSFNFLYVAKSRINKFIELGYTPLDINELYQYIDQHKWYNYKFTVSKYHLGTFLDTFDKTMNTLSPKYKEIYDKSRFKKELEIVKDIYFSKDPNVYRNVGINVSSNVSMFFNDTKKDFNSHIKILSDITFSVDFNKIYRLWVENRRFDSRSYCVLPQRVKRDMIALLANKRRILW